MTRPRTAADPPRLARFRVLRELGVGAQGSVHEALDLERDVHVALKTLRTLGPDEIVRFKVEFRAVRDLRHPNLVTLGDLIEDAGRWFFTMELVDGVDLVRYVRAEPSASEGASWSLPKTSETRTRVDVRAPARGDTEGNDAAAAPTLPPAPRSVRDASSFDEARLRSAFGQLAAGLSFLHQKGKVHRDLKPSNVLVDRAGRVVLIDFGVVAELRSRDEDQGHLIGTVAYMAPEQALGEAIGPEADWYAAGVLLFEALSGHRPFEGAAADVMADKCALDPPALSDFVRGVPPDLEALCMRLLAREPERRPTGAEVLLALDSAHVGGRARSDAPALAAPFVGRHAELGAIEAAYRSVRAGTATAVVIEGESGVGKSALAAHFCESLRALDRNIVILSGRCHEQERVPYNAFDAVIDALARYVRARRRATRAELLPPGMDRLRKLFPTLGVIDEVAASDGRASTPPEARGDRDEAFAALRELLHRVATRRPTMLLLDDVQWADGDSLALLGDLTRSPGAPPLLLLATARRREDGRACAALGAIQCELHTIALGGLPEVDASELVERLLSRRGAPTAIDRSAVIESTRGHPMFIEEMVRYLAQPRAQLATGAVALDDALSARVAELGASARRVLTLVAAAGRPVAHGVVTEAARLAPADYAEQVAALRDARLVRVRGERQDDAIEPYHDRVREAVLARLDGPARASLHAALGAVLEARDAGPDLLFHHFSLANDARRATRYAEAAAEVAARALAFDRSAALYRSALATADGDPERRRRLLTALGDRLTDAGRAKEAAASFLAAAGTGIVASSERLELERRAAEQFLMGGHLAEGLTATREVLAASGLSLPRSRLVALARLGWYQLRLARRPLTWTPRPPAPSSEARAVDVCWSVGAGLGMVDSARSMLFVSLGALLALDLGDEARIARALAVAAIGEAGLGRRPQALRLIEACRRAAASEGSERALYYGALATLGARFFLDNDWRASLGEAREAERLWNVTGRTEGYEADIVEQFVCWSLDNAGRLGELRAHVVPGVRAAQRSGNRFMEVNLRTQFVNLRLAEDRADDARADVQDAIASWLPGSTDFGNQDYLALRSLTWISLYTGDVGALERSLVEWRRFFGSLMAHVVFLRQDALAFAGWIALQRAADARARGDASATRRHVRDAERAVRAEAAIALPMAQSYVLHLRAGIEAVRGNDDRACELLHEALRDAEARGLELYAAGIRFRLGELVQGDHGRSLRATAKAWMDAQGVRVPERLVAAMLPGWPHPG